MLNRTNQFSWWIMFLIMLTVAAQCGAQPEQQPSTNVQAAPETGAHEDEEAHDDHEEENHVHAEMPDDDIATHLEDLAAVSLGEGEKLKVVATTTIVGDLVKQVAGDRIDLTVLLPLGSDPHAFSPTPHEVTTVADAHLVLMNGFGLEAFLRELIENAGGQAKVISLSEGIEPREFAGEEEGEHNEAGEAHEDEAEHAHEGVDPHTFMTAENAIIFVHNIEHALSTLDPANAAAYKEQAAAYESQLAELESWIQAQIETIPPENRQMVTDHDAFGYYTNHYGLEVVGAVIPAYSTSAEPSAQDLARLQDAIAEYGVLAVFVGTTVNPDMAQRVADDTGIHLVPLYSDSLGEAGSGAESYLEYMRYNTNAIVEALK